MSSVTDVRLQDRIPVLGLLVRVSIKQSGCNVPGGLRSVCGRVELFVCLFCVVVCRGGNQLFEHICVSNDMSVIVSASINGHDVTGTLPLDDICYRSNLAYTGSTRSILFCGTLFDFET